jgi:hypothetical protein
MGLTAAKPFLEVSSEQLTVMSKSWPLPVYRLLKLKKLIDYQSTTTTANRQQLTANRQKQND